MKHSHQQRLRIFIASVAAEGATGEKHPHRRRAPGSPDDRIRYRLLFDILRNVQ